MCGRDEARREVYKPKEEPEKRDRKKKKEGVDKEIEKKERERGKRERKERAGDSQKKNTCETDLVLETGLEGNLGGK